MRETRPPQTGERALLPAPARPVPRRPRRVGRQRRAARRCRTRLDLERDRPAVGHQRLHDRLRRIPAARRPARRRDRPAAGIPRRASGCSSAGQPRGRPRRVLGRAASPDVSSRAWAPPSLSPATLTILLASFAGGPAAGAGDGLVDGHRRRGRRDRRPRRRRAHGVAVVALGAAGQRRRSGSRCWWRRRACSATTPIDAPSAPGRARRRHRDRRTRRARARDHADRAARLDRRRRRSCRSRSRSCCWRRSSRSSGARRSRSCRCRLLRLPGLAAANGVTLVSGARAVRGLVLPHAVHAARCSAGRRCRRASGSCPHAGDRRGHAGHGPLAAGARRRAS